MELPHLTEGVVCPITTATVPPVPRNCGRCPMKHLKILGLQVKSLEDGSGSEYTGIGV